MCTVKFMLYRNLHFFDAGVNVKDCVVTWTDDGFVFDDDNLCGKEFEIITTSKDKHLVTYEHSKCTSGFLQLLWWSIQPIQRDLVNLVNVLQHVLLIYK